MTGTGARARININVSDSTSAMPLLQVSEKRALLQGSLFQKIILAVYIKHFFFLPFTPFAARIIGWRHITAPTTMESRFLKSKILHISRTAAERAGSAMAPRGTAAATPWWNGIHLIAAAGLCLRIAVAFASDSINHPDEIFQYLEQGHRLAFGYGYIPWEYRFGIRSYIIPGLIAALLYPLKILHFDDPAIYVPLVKSFFGLLSIPVIYALYVAGRNLASESAGRTAAVYACLWYQLIYFAQKPTPEVLAAYLIAGMVACASAFPGSRRPVLFGLIAGAAAALRYQYLPVIAFLCLVVCLAWERRETLQSAIASLLVILAAGLADHVAWGYPFSSYYQNYLFNGYLRISEFFGTEPAYYYIQVLIVTSAGLFSLFFILAPLRFGMTWLPAACTAICVLSHSIPLHKESRFVFMAVPLLLLIAAILVTEWSALCRRPGYRIIIKAAALAIIVLVSCAGAGYMKFLTTKDDILKAYLYLHHEPDLSGLFLKDSWWFGTGGFYYLHRDVPVYCRAHTSKGLVSEPEMHKYVSHVIRQRGGPGMKGFVKYAEIGTLEILKQANPPSRYLPPPGNIRDILINGIDDRYTPSVRRRF